MPHIPKKTLLTAAALALAAAGAAYALRPYLKTRRWRARGLPPETIDLIRALPSLSGVRYKYRAIRRLDGLAKPRSDAELHRVKDITIPGAQGHIRARLYIPHGKPPFPVMLYFHGGGFVFGGLRSADGVSRALCAHLGHVVLSVDYRLAPEHPYPAAPEDCYAALLWAHNRIASYGGDRDRLTVVGDSAGGTLAAVVSLMTRDRGGPCVHRQLLIYPFTDMCGKSEFALYPSLRENGRGPFLTYRSLLEFGHMYCPDSENRPDDPYLFPARAKSHAGLPDAMIVTAELDPLRDQGERYAAQLIADGTPAKALRVPATIHGFWGRTPGLTLDLIREAADWLGVEYIE